VNAGVRHAQRQLLFLSGRGEVQLEDVTIVILNADHCTLSYGPSHGPLTDHALIGKDTSHLNWHLFSRPGLPKVDHHRDPRSDCHPFIAAVEVAVSKPASTPIGFT